MELLVDSLITKNDIIQIIDKTLNKRNEGDNKAEILRNQNECLNECLDEYLDEYLNLAAQYVLNTVPLIVFQKQWDIPKTWEIFSYEDMINNIVEKSIAGMKDIEILTEIVGQNLLTRDSVSNGLKLPQTIQTELDILIDGFKHHQKTINFLKYMEGTLLDFNTIRGITDHQLSERMFYAVWEIFFQTIAINTDIDIINPEENVRADNLSRLRFNVNNITLIKKFGRIEKFTLEENVIMHINRTYPDLIILCLNALQIYRSGEIPDSNTHPIVDAVYSHIVSQVPQVTSM